MTVEYIQLDLTTVNHGVVAHGCNCQGKMGAGVALAIRKRWPPAYYEYLDLVHKLGLARATLLGECQLVKITDTVVSYLAVANCFTQVYYGRDRVKYASPDAISKSLFLAAKHAVDYNVPLYMSRIGCNLGGLSWDTDVLPIVTHIDEQLNPNIFVCDI